MVASSLPQAKCTHLRIKIALLAPETPPTAHTFISKTESWATK